LWPKSSHIMTKTTRFRKKLSSVLFWFKLAQNLFGLVGAYLAFIGWKVVLDIISLPKNSRKAFTEDRWGSLRISRFFRKLFEAGSTKKVLGANLAAAIILTSTFKTPIIALEKDKTFVENEAEEVMVLPEPEEVVTTETTYRWPVGGYISQTYHWYHPAIDLAGNDNQIIYPIASGKVVSVEYLRWSYGRNIIVDHGNGLLSRYAHLSYIKVELGKEVDKNTALGYVGSTGFSTGPHLHLEIVEDGQNINPLAVLPTTK